MNTLYLVDGTSQLFRAYFAIRGLSNADGLPTNAVYGFTTMLQKLIRDERPTYLAVVFDTPGPVFRHEQFAAYKANREPAPDDLNVQVPYAKQVCEALGARTLEKPGYEADDVIATYVERARAEGFRLVVVASDKDLLQLVGDQVEVLNPSHNQHLDADGVRETFGVLPERVRDVLGLMGDSVDNVPGVPGVGRKTALSIVTTYGDLDAAIERAHRFVAAFDARDALLASIDRATTAEPLSAEAVVDLRQRTSGFAAALGELLSIEADPAVRETLGRVGDLVARTDLDAARGVEGGSGRELGRALRELKREIKALDRGSAKRVWYAMSEHAELARASRELVTLHRDVPIEVGIDELRLRDPDRERAHDLFRVLEFRNLADEFAARDAGRPAPRATPPASRHVTAAARDVDQLAAACRAHGRIAVVARGDGPDPLRAELTGLAVSFAEGHGAWIPLADDPARGDAVRRALGPVLGDPAVAKVALDSKYAAHLLARRVAPVEGFVLDASVGAFLLDSGRASYGLDRLAREYLGHEMPAAQRSFLDDSENAPRPAEEADVVFRLAAALERGLDQEGLAELYRTIDGPLLPVLVRMEARGILVDVDRLGRMSKEMETSLDGLREEIHSLAGAPFNVDSPKQLREVLFDRLGLRPGRKTAKAKEASTDAQTLEGLESEHPIAGKLLEYRELSKLKGTYVDALPRLVHPETGRVHTTFHPTGAATGRLSSSDPNLQNIPARSAAGRRIREAFVPAPGHVFLASDYSQIELRVLAHLCQDEELIEAFRAGEDIHRHTASRIFDVALGEVTTQMRRRAKAVNFGVLYGMSETRLAREQGIARTEAKQFIQAYFERFGRVRGYVDSVREAARRDGAVRTMFGRVRLFPQLRQRIQRAAQEQALRAAVNTTIQGSGADLMKMAMLRVDRELRRAGLEDARILLQVHDELLMEVPEGSVAAVRELVKAAMEGVHPLRVPLVVDQKAGSSWAEVT